MTTYSAIGGLALIGTGEESGTWGTVTNLNLRALDRSGHGYTTIDLTSEGTTYNLVTNDITQSSDLDAKGHYKGLRFTNASADTTIVVKSGNATTEFTQTKVYLVINATAHNLIFDQDDVASQITIAAGKSKIIFAAGGSLHDMSSTLEMDSVKINGGTIVSDNATISGGSITNITDLAVADGGTGASDASGARLNLGLVIDQDVMGFYNNLDLLRNDNTNIQVDNNVLVTDATGDLQLETGDTLIASIGFAGTISDYDKVVVTTDGTAEASKALVVDANRDIGNIRNIAAVSYDETFVENGTTAAFDLAAGSVFLYEPTANAVTVSFTNLPQAADTFCKTWTMIVRPSNVNPAITWPTNVTWTNGYTPADPSTNETKMYTFLAVPPQGGGVPEIFGFLAGDNFY